MPYLVGYYFKGLLILTDESAGLTGPSEDCSVASLSVQVRAPCASMVARLSAPHCLILGLLKYFAYKLHQEPLPLHLLATILFVANALTSTPTHLCCQNSLATEITTGPLQHALPLRLH
jgi:hypothetical protein